MAVDFDSFVDWATDRFNGDIVIKGNEVKLNSIFAEDSKFHLWCNPYGGKHDREDGCYRCFYTEEKGTLVGLVMRVDGCSYKEAKDILSGRTPLRQLEDELDAFFLQKEKEVETPQAPALELPDSTWPIKSMPAASLHKMDAEYYLEKRKIPVGNLHLCTAGDYRNRIVIPYFDRNGRLIYWNSRALNDDMALRYQGPPKSSGVGKGDVIFMPSWPKPGSKIYVTEGEFDAMSLTACGLNGAACGGRSMSDAQVLMLKDYVICLTLDTDEAGFQGQITMAQKLMRVGVTKISFVRPPVGYKDWNTMLVRHDTKLMLAYIEKAEKPFDDWTAMRLEFGRI